MMQEAIESLRENDNRSAGDQFFVVPPWMAQRFAAEELRRLNCHLAVDAFKSYTSRPGRKRDRVVVRSLPLVHHLT